MLKKILFLMLLALSIHQTLVAQANDNRFSEIAKEYQSREKSEIDWLGELVKGGNTSLALVALAFAGLAFTLERLMVLRRPTYFSSRTLTKIKSAWEEDEQSLEKVLKKKNSILVKVIAYLHKSRKENPDMNQWDYEKDGTIAEDIALREIRRQQQRNYPLAVVSTLSPLLGLLGTMIGMIEAFNKVAIMGDTGDASLLADSIGKALITTAVGLVIALPSLALYHFFKQRAVFLGMRLEEKVEEFLAHCWNKHTSRLSEK